MQHLKTKANKCIPWTIIGICIMEKLVYVIVLSGHYYVDLQKLALNDQGETEQYFFHSVQQ